MQTSLIPASTTRRALRGAALLAFLVASVVLAVTASDAPPAPPAWKAVSAGTANFDNISFQFREQQGQIVLNWKDANTANNPVTGYRLYIGTAARAAGKPFDAGNTPYDLGVALTATIGGDVAFTVNKAQVLRVAVTAYNSFGNESDYSTKPGGAAIYPVSAPTVSSVEKIGTTSLKLNLTQGSLLAPCTGCVVKTEIWRVDPSATAPKFLVVLNAGTTSFTDSNLAEGTTYQYQLRSFVDVSGVAGLDSGNPFTYSAVATRSATTDATIEIPFQVVVRGNEVKAADLLAGDEVRVDLPSGQVTFAPSPSPEECSSVQFTVGPDGLPRGTYNSSNSTIVFCYNTEKNCGGGSDPFNGEGHAGLTMKVGNSRSFIGRSAPNFTASAAGALSFGVNDCQTGNNTGGFTVSGTVFRTP
jgi:hypothetical protein